uniref:Uncharacterized protein n=1 Tax=Lepeophtheirus salmonis TaxID=72036 RepID=A0A0K2T5C0_LEPSM
MITAKGNQKDLFRWQLQKSYSFIWDNTYIKAVLECISKGGEANYIMVTSESSKLTI